jgi:hypothetical protein
MWVAIAAITLASVSRAEAGLDSAGAYAHPVLQFLASHSQSAAAKPGVPRPAQRGSLFRDSGAGAWMAMLPVFFVGLVAPLRPSPARFGRAIGKTHAAPLLPSSFQRPPPFFV